MRHTRILPIILLLTACAPAAPVPTATPLPPTVTATAVPTSTSTLEPTSTPEPTATLTATPFPIPEGAVKTADGSTIFVKDGKLWQLDAQGQAAEKDILDVTFANVIDSGNIVKQLHPEYYDDDQKLLKDTLLPKGAKITDGYRWRVDGFNTLRSAEKNDGVTLFLTAGIVLEISRVDLKNFPSLNVETGFVMNMAFMDAEEPVPVVMGVIDSQGQYSPFLRGYASAPVGNSMIEGSLKYKFEKRTLEINESIDFFRGKNIGITLIGLVDPGKADEFTGMESLFSGYAELAHDSATLHAASLAWKVRQENKTAGKTNETSGDFLGDVVMAAVNNPDAMGPGFIPHQPFVMRYEKE